MTIVQKTSDVDQLIAMLTNSLKCLKGKEVESYRKTLKEFSAFLTKRDVVALANACVSDAVQFLEKKSLKSSQHSLDRQRIEIQSVMHLLGTLSEGDTIPRIFSKKFGKRKLKNEYTQADVDAITAQMSEEDALMTRLCFECGLRATEIFSLRQGASETAECGNDAPFLWSGRLGQAFRVTNSQGEERTVSIPDDLAELLLKRRFLFEQKEVHKDEIWTVEFDLPSAMSFAKTFKEKSEAILGWHTSVYGLRHAFARRREKELSGYFSNARLKRVIALEMGAKLGEDISSFWI